jgi:hypothetical protein
MSTQIKLNSTTPAAPPGGLNVTFQHDASDPVNCSAYLLESGLEGLGFATKAGVQDQSYSYAADTGSANTYVVALTPAPAFGSPEVMPTGLRVAFKAANGNTGASTLNVNSFGAVAIKKGSGSTALASGDIGSGQVVVCIFDGTNFQMVSPSATSSGGGTINFSIGENLTSQVGGSPLNQSFTLAHTPVSGSVALYLNGQRLTLEFGSPVVGDYTISSSTITMAVAPSSGDVLIADYRY